MKKSIIALSLVFLLSLMFAPLASAGAVLDRIMQKGELLVGTTGQQPPMNATTKAGKLIGMDVDLAEAMGAALGVKVKFDTMIFADLLPALENGKVDMVISGMTATPARNKRVAFVGPYYVSGKGLLAKAERYAVMKAEEGLNTPEVTVAALKYSTSQKFAETLMPKARLITTDSYSEAIDLILEGKVDVLVADYPFCALTSYRYQDKGLAAGQSPLTFEPLGIAMAEDALLINWVQNFLITLKGSGELKKMHPKWL
ncbi:MAG: transporter substrate-binding domain-containing protein, partial [Desulfosarcina sp.]|nr:transporter substrate-binding domain-containing protein [Desulfobacterales bacterium]